MDKQDKVALIFFGVVLVAGATIGSLSGLWLSSRVLSPLVAGGVLGFIVPALFLTFCILSPLKKLCKGNGKRKDLDYVIKATSWTATSAFEGNGKRKDLDYVIKATSWTAASAFVGVGLGFAANTIFPGVMLATGSPALVGAVIGAIAPIVGLSAAQYVITPLAEEVNEHIISPIIEWVSSGKKEVS